MSPCKWVKYDHCTTKKCDMVKVGKDKDNSDLFVGRAHHDGDLIPGKMKMNENCVYVSYHGKEHKKTDFEVLLLCHYKWVESCNGCVPHCTVEGGKTCGGEPLYVGRAWKDGVVVAGKIHKSHGRMYGSFHGHEIGFNQYEALVAC